MADSHFSIDPADTGLPLDAYDLLVHAVAPRPIAFVSTQGVDGSRNLAPFSFFNAGGANPPSVVFSPCTKADGSAKDTLRNIGETGEYVINIVSDAMREGMVRTSAPLPYGDSEWPVSGFTAASSVKVAPPRVAEAPFALECRLHQIVPHGTGPDAANYVIGEVVHLHAARSLFVDGKIRPERIHQIARLGDGWYLRVTPEALFEMKRPAL